MTARSLVALERWAQRAALAGLALALALPLAAFLVDTGWGREVLLIAPHDPSVVTLNRSLWGAGDPVPELYGSPMSTPIRVLMFGNQEVIRPEEAPGLALLAAASAGGRPIQMRTVWWTVRLAETALAAVVVALFGSSAYLRRRQRQSRRASHA